ncbi:MAG: hypothetical protein ACRBFS_18950 [Aureispira sp.]
MNVLDEAPEGAITSDIDKFFLIDFSILSAFVFSNPLRGNL